MILLDSQAKAKYLHSFFFFNFWGFVAVWGPSSSCHEQGLLLIVVHGLFIALVSLVAEHRL